MERMTYKGYESTPKHDAECGVFYGLVDGIDGLCEYESETAEGIEKAFRDAVDDYIDAYRESFGLSAMIDATDAAEIRFLVDAETLGWLERESARTGISLEKVASAMLRKACGETPALGAPGATVSAGRAETAEVRCDARRRSAMKDTCCAEAAARRPSPQSRWTWCSATEPRRKKQLKPDTVQGGGR